MPITWEKKLIFQLSSIWIKKWKYVIFEIYSYWSNHMGLFFEKQKLKKSF